MFSKIKEIILEINVLIAGLGSFTFIGIAKKATEHS